MPPGVLEPFSDVLLLIWWVSKIRSSGAKAKATTPPTALPAEVPVSVSVKPHTRDLIQFDLYSLSQWPRCTSVKVSAGTGTSYDIGANLRQALPVRTACTARCEQVHTGANRHERIVCDYAWCELHTLGLPRYHVWHSFEERINSRLSYFRNW